MRSRDPNRLNGHAAGRDEKADVISQRKQAARDYFCEGKRFRIRTRLSRRTERRRSACVYSTAL
jgi:hypothetical protein